MKKEKPRTIITLSRKNPKRETVTETIPPISRIIEKDEKTGEKVEKTICYIPGRSDIYLSKEEEADLSKFRKRIQSIKVVNGRHSVHPGEITKLKYLEKCSYNAANHENGTAYPDSNATFKFLDWEKEATREFEMESMITEARNKVAEMNGDELRAYLMVIDKNPTAARLLEDQEESVLRLRATRLAQGNPEKFLEVLKNPKTKREYYVRAAIASARLDVQGGTLLWHNGQEISTAPKGVDPIEYFVDLSLNNDEYQDVFDLIRKEVGELNTKKDEASKSVDDIYKDVYQKLMKEGILSTKGKKIIYEREEGEDKEWATTKTLLTSMKGEPELFAELLSKLNK